MAKRGISFNYNPSITKYFRQSDADTSDPTEVEEDVRSTTSSAHTDSSSIENETTDQHLYDGIITDSGQVFNDLMTVAEISKAVSDLSLGEKYTLLTNHYRPSRKFKFPKVFDNGCNRSFRV